MIEAVNSSIANTQVLRSNVDRAVSAPVVSAKPVSSENTPDAPKAPYVSPYIAIDTTNNKAVLQIRDRDTGDVKDQYPSDSRLAELSQQQSREINRTKVRDTAASGQAEHNAPAPQTTDIITVQDVTSNAPSNISLPLPQIASAALSAASQSGQVPSSSSVSVSA